MTIQQYEQRSEVALATTQDVAVQRLGEWARSAEAAHHVAVTLVQTSFCPEQFRNKPGEATAAILAGMEIGLQPMAALRSFDVIQGQAAARAITLRAIVQSQGHELEVVESTSARCRMRGRRKGSSDWQNVTWDIARAQQLGLTNKPNWKNQPQTMLVARATSELARLIASDAILGLPYSIEELADGAGEQIDTAPAPTNGTRKMSRTMPTPESSAPEPNQADTPDSVAPPVSDVDSSGAELSDKTRGHMFALFAEVGPEWTDDQQREFLTDTIGRLVESRATLTEQEAQTGINRLQGIKDGREGYEWIPAAEVVQ